MEIGKWKMKPKSVCNDCKKEYKTKDIIIKLGGALCPHCRVILHLPFTKEYAKLKKQQSN